MIIKDQSKYKELFSLIGICLIASQRMEFLIQGVVSLYGGIDKNKQFKNISPQAFLEDSEEGKKLRKKTLGQLIDKTKEFEIIDSIRLDNYVKLRNLIVHNLWRDELNGKIQNKNLEKCIQLCNNFIIESTEIENIFKGFMYSVYKFLKTERNVSTSETIEQWKIFENDFNK